jgi:GNAT superfamily N-acetyltransferase
VTLTLDRLARLVGAALPDEGLSATDLETCCYGPDTVILGDDHGAAVLTRQRFGDAAAAWLVLLAVHPDRRREGRGRELVGACAEGARAAGALDLHLGNAIPRYVWPGVDYRYTAALSLFEALGFEPYGAECNMAITTGFRADPPDGVVIERETGAGAAALAARCFPHWVDEVERGTAGGACFAARSDRGDGGFADPRRRSRSLRRRPIDHSDTIGFACHSVNRHGWIGPMATDPERQRAGVGRALLGALCTDLARNGVDEAEIAWVGPAGFYAKAGARVSRVFRTAKLRL